MLHNRARVTKGNNFNDSELNSECGGQRWRTLFVLGVASSHAAPWQRIIRGRDCLSCLPSHVVVSLRSTPDDSGPLHNPIMWWCPQVTIILKFYKSYRGLVSLSAVAKGHNLKSFAGSFMVLFLDLNRSVDLISGLSCILVGSLVLASPRHQLWLGGWPWIGRLDGNEAQMSDEDGDAWLRRRRRRSWNGHSAAYNLGFDSGLSFGRTDNFSGRQINVLCSYVSPRVGMEINLQMDTIR